jgi:hypothetical protein
MDNNLVAFTYGREEKIKGRPYLLPVRYLLCVRPRPVLTGSVACFPLWLVAGR